MGLMSFLDRSLRGDLPERSDPVIGFDVWAEMWQAFSFQGVTYSTPTQTQEDPGSSFLGLARGAYKTNGIVYSCIANRIDLFSEARFIYRRRRDNRPGGLFGTRDPNGLPLLEKPWQGATTGDLLARMLLYHDIAGNAYVVRSRGRLTLLRPDWVTIIGGVRGNKDASIWAADAEVLGYAYQEGGPGGGNDPVIYLPEEVAHFATRPDPEARFRGMSWLTPVIREIMSDKAATDHKLKFFENAATPQLAVKLDVNDLEIYKKWIEQFKQDHVGVRNAYKTMFLGAGADVTTVGANLQQIEFKVTQGAGETRIAAAAGVPPVVVGLSEGLAAATYSNYAQARRRFADQTIRPLWRNAAGSLANIISVPPDAELWYDDRDIAALSEDAKDQAEIQNQNAAAIKQLIDAGFDPDAVIQAIEANDLTALSGAHSGLYSVQLQPAGSVSQGKGSLMQGTVVPAQKSPNGNSQLPAAPPMRELEPTQLTIHMPEMHIHPPDVHVDAPITVEPVRFDAEAINVKVELPETQMPDPPIIDVHYEEPRKRSRRIALPSGERATVTDENGKTTVEFDDGRMAVVEDVDE